MSITALNNTVTVFQPICKGHFLGSLTQSCHSSFFFFCTVLLAPFSSLYDIQMISLFKLSLLQYQEVVCHCHYINHVSLLEIVCILYKQFQAFTCVAQNFCEDP